MTRALALTLAALLAVGSLPFLSVAHAEKNPEWSSIRKDFKDLFKTKNSIADRQKGIALVAQSKDPRGVDELLKALKKQEKHSDKKRDEYETGEAEWAEKTERLEAQREKKHERARERAREKGTEPEPVSTSGEELDWLGANQQEGEMHREKRRLQKEYRAVLAEEEFTIYILRATAKILNALEGEEYEKAAKPVAKTALRAPKRYKSAYTKMLGYIKGDVITEALAELAEDSKIEIQMLALESIGRQNSDRGKEILYQYLTHEEWQVRAAAIQGLAFYRDAEVMDRLMAQARKEEGHLRRRCFGAMSVIVGEKVKGTIESWESWWGSNKAEWLERWERLPRSGMPIPDDPPVIIVDSEESGAGTSFYGIKTDSKHIIFVVDISGSMTHDGDPDNPPEEGKRPIDTARTELKNAIKTLSAVDEDERGAASFNIVVFASFVETFKEGKMVVATKKNKDKAMEWIDENIQPKGNTNCFDALDAAFNIISDTSDKKNRDKGADTIFFMTDGHPNRGKYWDPELIVEEVTRMNQERKLTIHTIGVGEKHYVQFLQALAANNNGKYLAR